MQDLTFRQMSLKMKRKEEVLGMRYEIKGDTLPVVVCYLEGGEGVFNTVVTGPGRVWLQTMPICNVAASIRPFISTGNG